MTLGQILVVDDENSIRELLFRILTRAGYQVVLAANGREAIEKCSCASFDLIISDIRMPRIDGIELGQKIKAWSPDTELLIITGFTDIDLAIEAMRIGASDFILKPFKEAQVLLSVERALERRRILLENRLYQQGLEKLVAERTRELALRSEELERAYELLLQTLGAVLDTRDTETQAHSFRVTTYATALARKLGIDGESLRDLQWGVYLHDIGKIGIPDAILFKPGKLTEDEWAVMKRHPIIGSRLLRRMDFLAGASLIVLYHHEKWDGSGYPQGLKETEIPIGARIFALVDTLDAITSDRPYHKAEPFSAARAEIIRCSGSHFDPEVVNAFLSIPENEWLKMRAEAERLAARNNDERFAVAVPAKDA